MDDTGVRVEVEIGRGTPPLSAILGIREGLRGVESCLRRNVAEARRAGHSWQEIADALGVSRQSAWERFKDEEPNRADVIAQVLGSLRGPPGGPSLEEIRAEERKVEAEIEERRYRKQ